MKQITLSSGIDDEFIPVFFPFARNFFLVWISLIISRLNGVDQMETRWKIVHIHLIGTHLLAVSVVFKVKFNANIMVEPRMKKNTLRLALSWHTHTHNVCIWQIYYWEKFRENSVHTPHSKVSERVRVAFFVLLRFGWCSIPKNILLRFNL